MTKVSDIMKKDVFRLSPDTPLPIAAHALEQQFIGGAPVCDEEDLVLGHLSQKDLVEVGERRRSHESVGDRMVHAVVSVRPEAPALDAIRMMVDQSVHRVVVIDAGGRLAGIVTTMDVLQAVLHGVPLNRS